MPKALIYQPAKTAMQSGKAKTGNWLLEFVAEKPQYVEPLMGWTGMSDMPQEIKLFFPTKEAAMTYAQKNRIAFDVFEPNRRKLVKKAYADNFKYRVIGGQ